MAKDLNKIENREEATLIATTFLAGWFNYLDQEKAAKDNPTMKGEIHERNEFRS